MSLKRKLNRNLITLYDVTKHFKFLIEIKIYTYLMLTLICRQVDVTEILSRFKATI